MLIELTSRNEIQRLPKQKVERITEMLGFAETPHALTQAIRGVVRHNLSLGCGLFFKYENATLNVASLAYIARDRRSLKRLEGCMTLFDALLLVEAFPDQNPFAFHHEAGALVMYPQRI